MILPILYIIINNVQSRDDTHTHTKDHGHILYVVRRKIYKTIYTRVRVNAHSRRPVRGVLGIFDRRRACSVQRRVERASFGKRTKLYVIK